MPLKIIFQTIAVIFLLHGTATAFLRKDEFFIKNGTRDDDEHIKKSRITIFITNVLIWGGAILAINIFM